MVLHLPPELLNWLTTGAGVVASVVAAAAAALKFQAWWQDRWTQTRMDSAAFFVKEGAAPWQKPFGERQLVRLHFARLTGIDREIGHEAILRCHERLGGTDSDWQALRKAGGFVRASGTIARVRKLHRRDHFGTAAIVLGGVLAAVFSLLLIDLMVALSAKTSWTAVSLETLLALIVTGTYAGMFALFAWVAFVHFKRYMTARELRRRLTQLGLERRARLRTLKGRAAQELHLLVEATPDAAVQSVAKVTPSSALAQHEQIVLSKSVESGSTPHTLP